MKKLLMILVAAALVMTANTGCDVDADLGGVYNIYDIPVRSSEWIPVSSAADVLEYMYVDKPIPELDDVFGRASYATYFKYMDGNEPVEVPLPYTVYELYDGIEVEYTVRAEYSPGNLRLVLTTSDFYSSKPDETWMFRLAITR
jgi:hypothetical protein